MKTCFYGNISTDSTKYDLLIVLEDCSNATIYLAMVRALGRQPKVSQDYNMLFTAYEYLDHENSQTCFLVKL